MDSFLEYAVRASLVSLLDKRVLVVLRDDRKYIGFLRSFDQFSNVFINAAVERRYCEDKFCDKPAGNMLIRGENVVIMGEIDGGKFREHRAQSVSEEEFAALLKRKQEREEEAKRASGPAARRTHGFDDE